MNYEFDYEEYVQHLKNNQKRQDNHNDNNKQYQKIHKNRFQTNLKIYYDDTLKNNNTQSNLYLNTDKVEQDNIS